MPVNRVYVVEAKDKVGRRVTFYIQTKSLREAFDIALELKTISEVTAVYPLVKDEEGGND